MLSPQQIPHLLLAPGEKLPSKVKRQIVELGAEAIGPLLSVLEDDSLLDTESPGRGWGPIRAAMLLGELREERAIPRLLRLAQEGPDAIITNQSVRALQKMGELSMEPILVAAESTEDEFYRSLLSEVLATSQRKDERIFQVLMKAYQDNPEPVMGALATYGDQRAVPELLRFLDNFRPASEENWLADQVLVELQAALQGLGAKLTPSQQTLLDQHLQQLERRREIAFAQPGSSSRAPSASHAAIAKSKKVGRNDPCPCGSGKKFKKCCG